MQRMNAEDAPANGTSDDGVARAMAEWIGQYLNFAQEASPHEVLESWQTHRNVWLHLPELVLTIFNYKRYVSRLDPPQGDWC